MGRNAKPTSLHIAQGNPNRLTKAEITRRQAAEVHLGNHKLKCPDYVKRNVVAYEKWKEIAKIYKDVDFVSSGDVGLLGRYCMTFSEYRGLIDTREKIMILDFEPDEVARTYEDIEDKYGKIQAGKLFDKINFILSAAGVLTFDSAVNKKMDMLIKMEDRIFLTPLSKVKNVPKKEEKKTDPLAEKGFGNV